MSSELKDPAFHARIRQLIGSETEPFVWAKEMGIPKATFSRMWKEGTVPGAEHLKRIADRTGVSLDWLVAGNGPMKRGMEGKAGAVREAQVFLSYNHQDADLAEIVSILQSDLPEAKKFILQVLRGRKEVKAGLEGLGLKLKEES